MTVDAPHATVFRWLTQLKVAPYSYDLLDNLGRPSAREIIPELQHLHPGDIVPMSPDGKQGMAKSAPPSQASLAG